MADSLNNLVVVEGSKKEHFRRGQGLGSGNGKTAGKGQKGQGAHAHTKKHGFEGGQMPLSSPLTEVRFQEPRPRRVCRRQPRGAQPLQRWHEVTETLFMKADW
jgi:large subunit ribosomal protein L15